MTQNVAIRYNEDFVFHKNLQVDGNILGRGNLQVSGNLSVDGSSTLNDSLDVYGDVEAHRDVQVDGDLKIKKTYYSSGTEVAHGASKNSNGFLQTQLPRTFSSSIKGYIYKVEMMLGFNDGKFESKDGHDCYIWTVLSSIVDPTSTTTYGGQTYLASSLNHVKPKEDQYGSNFVIEFNFDDVYFDGTSGDFLRLSIFNEKLVNTKYGSRTDEGRYKWIDENGEEHYGPHNSEKDLEILGGGSKGNEPIRVKQRVPLNGYKLYDTNKTYLNQHIRGDQVSSYYEDGWRFIDADGTTVSEVSNKGYMQNDWSLDSSTQEYSKIWSLGSWYINQGHPFVKIYFKNENCEELYVVNDVVNELRESLDKYEAIYPRLLELLAGGGSVPSDLVVRLEALETFKSTMQSTIVVGPGTELPIVVTEEYQENTQNT